jgi:TatD DNase family protein
MFIDSNCHLEGPKFDADRVPVLQRAAALGIEALLAIGNGTGPGTYDCGIRVADEFDGTPGVPRIYTSVGIHPHEAKIADAAALAELEQLARHPKVIAWGEIGLDYWYDLSPRELQRSVFVRQMELARAAKKPIIIHCRPSKDSNDAWDDTIRLLKLNWAATGLGGILHCFNGTLEQLQAGLNMGFMISFAGNVTFPKMEDVRTGARQVPPDRMLIETDSPYLAPFPHRGHRNEPAHVTETARYIADLRDISLEELGTQTAANFYRFFSLSR